MMTSKLRVVVSKTVGAEWLEWLEWFKGNIYHSIEWAETHCLNYSRPLFFCCLDDKDRCLGIAVGIKRWSPTRYIGRFFKRLDFESYPAVEGNDVDLARFMIKQIVKFARKEGYRSLAIQSYCTNVMVPDMEQLGFITKPRVEFIVDLTISEDELWKRLSSHHRRKIKKANKHGLLFEEACTMDAMRELRKLQMMFRDRRMQQGEYFGTVNEIYYEEMAKRYFDKNLGRVFLMTHGKQVVSAAFVTIYAGRAFYVLGGNSTEGLMLDAPALLFWKIFSYCRELACKEFNMGGVPDSAVNPESKLYGLYRFKAGFGTQQVKCLSGSAENLNPLHGWLVRIAQKALQVRLS